MSKWLAKGLGCLIPQWRPVTMMGLTRVIKLFFPELVRETVLVPLKDLSDEMNLSESNAADKAQRHYAKSVEALNKALSMEMSSKPSVEDAVYD
eukprot:UN18198